MKTQVFKQLTQNIKLFSLAAIATAATLISNAQDKSAAKTGIAVKVSYTIEDDYVADNKKNIAAFLEAFKKLDNNAFLYSVYVLADGKTFVHISQYRDEKIQQQLLKEPAFLLFQQNRDKHLASQPTIEVLAPVGASKPVF